MRFIQLIRSWWRRHFKCEMNANVFTTAFEPPKSEWRSIVEEPPEGGKLVVYQGEDGGKDRCGVYKYYAIMGSTMLAMIGHHGQEYQKRGSIDNPQGLWKSFD